MTYSLLELILFVLAFLLGYYALSNWTATGKAY